MSDAPRGCYVYCVIPSGERPPLAGVTDVGRASDLRVLAADGLSAVVGDVPLDEFGAEALERNFEDLGWLERTARAHQAVLDAVLAVDAMVPLRLCTIFRDEEHVRQLLEREHERFEDALERVRGRAEWSVKLLADPRRLEAAERGRSQPQGAGGEGERPGHEFFARKKQDRQLRDDVRATMDAAAAETHARLQQEAAASVRLRPQHPAVSRREREMVLNAAYLVERSRAPAFEAATRELAERHRPANLELEVTGPWAPYNFVGAPEAAT
jgi:Gas vesicle synthesis protein GvpL/GvpF